MGIGILSTQSQFAASYRSGKNQSGGIQGIGYIVEGRDHPVFFRLVGQTGNLIHAVLFMDITPIAVQIQVNAPTVQLTDVVDIQLMGILLVNLKIRTDGIFYQTINFYLSVKIYRSIVEKNALMQCLCKIICLFLSAIRDIYRFTDSRPYTLIYYSPAEFPF